jgi:hypothetical protein
MTCGRRKSGARRIPNSESAVNALAAVSSCPLSTKVRKVKTVTSTGIVDMAKKLRAFKMAA